jgi:hypothetical protein
MNTDFFSPHPSPLPWGEGEFITAGLKYREAALVLFPLLGERVRVRERNVTPPAPCCCNPKSAIVCLKSPLKRNDDEPLVSDAQ